jgi:hypothetical protein
MQSVSLDRPMPFTAALENAVPPGAIETSGSFGPWGREEPGQTPLDGTFTFERADLGVEKLQLDGVFTIANASFASPLVQSKINELSRRTQEQGTAQAAKVVSQFAGKFTLRAGELALPLVTFDVPGSAIRLSGQYGLVSERIDFAATIFTDATVSEMTTGYKSLLLKPVDLIFKRDGGGSAIPIRVTGTRREPAFGLDKGRVFNRTPSREPPRRAPAR